MIKPVAVTATAVFLALGSVGLGTSSASTAASEIPFKATFSGRSARPNQTTVLLDGSGTATHLGRTTNAGHVTVTGYSPACTEGVTAVNVEVLTAANGDTLTLTSNDVTCPTPPGQASKYHGTGHWTVSGGTGRFMYATGSGSFDGIADLGAHTFTITLTGSIDFGGKDS